MLKVTIEDEEESKSVKCESALAVVYSKNRENPSLRTITEGDVSPEDILVMSSFAIKEAYETLKEITNSDISFDLFIDSIKDAVKNADKTLKEDNDEKSSEEDINNSCNQE